MTLELTINGKKEEAFELMDFLVTQLKFKGNCFKFFIDYDKNEVESYGTVESILTDNKHRCVEVVRKANEPKEFSLLDFDDSIFDDLGELEE